MACRSAAGKRFGVAFLVVGAVATVYHASWGRRFRPAARKVDYWAIAASSMVLSAAIWGPLPGLVGAAMGLAIPFMPTLVSTTNFTLVEVKYLLLAMANPSMVRAWARHLGITVAATACFALEDSPLLGWCPLAHSTFHVLSAWGFLTLSACITALEAAAA